MGGTLAISAGDNLGGGTLTLNSGASFDLVNDISIISLTNAIVIAGDATFDLVGDTSADLSGAITDYPATNGGFALTGGGTLTLSGAGSFSLDVAIEGGSTLELQSATAAGDGDITFNASGGFRNSLIIGAGDIPTNALAGFDPDDSIELLGVVGDAAAVNNADQLVVTEGAGAVATLSLFGDYSALAFLVTSNKYGDSFIAALSEVVTMARLNDDLGQYNSLPDGFTIADSERDIRAHLKEIESEAQSGHVDAVRFTDKSPPTLSVTANVHNVDRLAFAKIASPYVLEVTSGVDTIVTTGHGAKLTIDDVKGHDTISGRGSSETFVFSGKGFGTAVITDAQSHWTGATRDHIDFAGSDFTSFKALSAHASIEHGVVEVTSGSDHLILDGFTSLKALTAANGTWRDFTF